MAVRLPIYLQHLYDTDHSHLLQQFISSVRTDHSHRPLTLLAIDVLTSW